VSSNLASKIERFIEEGFPSYTLRKEKYVTYFNTQLFFDFYMPEFKLLIEVQGQQHYSFNKLYHFDITDFNKQQYRDSLKTQWASENNLKLLILKFDDIELMTKEQFKQLIISVI